MEVNSETDFVARNELFQGLVLKLAQATLSLPSNLEGQSRELNLQQVCNKWMSACLLWVQPDLNVFHLHPSQKYADVILCVVSSFFWAQVLNIPTSNASTVSEACAEVAGQVRENVRIRRAFKVQSTTGKWVGREISQFVQIFPCSKV